MDDVPPEQDYSEERFLVARAERAAVEAAWAAPYSRPRHEGYTPMAVAVAAGRVACWLVWDGRAGLGDEQTAIMPIILGGVAGVCYAYQAPAAAAAYAHAFAQVLKTAGERVAVIPRQPAPPGREHLRDTFPARYRTAALATVDT